MFLTTFYYRKGYVMGKTNLDTADYKTEFAKTPIYANERTVRAVRITTTGLRTFAYTDRDVRFDIELNKFVIDTYVMQDVPSEDLVFGRSDSFIRIAELEHTRPVKVGEWIVTNPKELECDHATNYTMSDEAFRKQYEPTDEPGVFRLRD